MPLVLNASSVEQTVQAHGAWFTFGPGQMKMMNDDKVGFLTSYKAYMGFVALPESMEDPAFANSEAGKKILAEAKAAGVNNRIKHLDAVKQNELVSLKRDLEQKNIKADVRAFMSDGAIAAMKEIVGYQKKGQDEAAKKIAEIEELEKLLEG